MRRSLAVAVCGLLILLGSGGVYFYAFHQPNGAAASASPQPVTMPTGTNPTQTPSETATAPVPDPSTTTSKVGKSKTAPSPRPKANAKPEWLSIPSVGIDESIVPMGLTKAGEVEPPAKQTIWYTGSPKPGKPGISVVAGHVEFSGPDNFWRLDEVPKGAVITLRYSDGTSVRFVVRHKRSELKTDVQQDGEIWGTSPTPKLVLITCDKRSKVVNHHHLNNFLVFAELA